MNLKKKIKRFFTLTRKENSGFTLVELIVVIAILGVLGGVAVPVYSGYVNKANRAADEQLLAAVNKSFAAACAVNGTDNFNLPDIPNIILAGEDGAKSVGSIDMFAEDFMRFYNETDGEDGKEFKVFTELAFDEEFGVFIEGAVIMFGEYRIAISKALADAMKDNTFSDIGAATLTGKVNKVSDVAAILIDHIDDEGERTLFYDIVNTPEYLLSLKDSLKMTDEEFVQFVMNDDDTFKSDVLANSLVLTAAQKTQNLDTSFLGATGSAERLRNELENEATATEAMAKLALTYGMYTSYVKTNPDMVDESEALLEQDTFTGMTEILASIETEEFQDYLASSKGQSDLNAYMASMQIINDSANQSSDAAKDILTNGFSDPELVAALNGLMGN